MNPFIRYEILSHLECRLTLRRLMAVNRAFHSLLQPMLPHGQQLLRL